MESLFFFALIFTLLCLSSSTFLPSKKDKYSGKSNSVRQRMKPTGPLFKNDWDIARFLKLYGVEMMLWRCRNAIQPEYNSQPLPCVDLHCEVIGRIKSVTWCHNGQEIDLNDLSGKYGHVVIPHYSNGHYYSRWIDFQLQIFNATEMDGGLYTFEVTSMHERSQTQVIYVDISDKKRKRSRSEEVKPPADKV